MLSILIRLCGTAFSASSQGNMCCQAKRLYPNGVQRMKLKEIIGILGPVFVVLLSALPLATPESLPLDLDLSKAAISSHSVVEQTVLPGYKDGLIFSALPDHRSSNDLISETHQQRRRLRQNADIHGQYPFAQAVQQLQLKRWTCPYDAMPVNEREVVEFKGYQKVYFCAMNHVPQFLRNPSQVFGDITTGDKGIISEDDIQRMRCPVCGMKMESESAWHIHFKSGNQALHTCSQSCAQQIVNHPSDYIVQDMMSPAGDAMPSSISPKNQFCNGIPSVMFLGFSTVQPDGDCVLLWLSSWSLDTRVKMYAGIFGVFFLAFISEGLTSYQRYLSKVKRYQSIYGYRVMRESSSRTNEKTLLLEKDSTPRNRVSFSDVIAPTPAPRVVKTEWKVFRRGLGKGYIWRNVAVSALHGVRIFIAYLLMLAAMTYNISMNVAIVLGFAVGHYIFSDAPASYDNTSDPADELEQVISSGDDETDEFADPCCAN